MLELNNLLYDSKAIRKTYGYYERPVFNSEQRLGKGTNYESQWAVFKSRLNPFISLDLAPHLSTKSEMLFTDKAVSWGTEDVNLWIGGEDREIMEVDDLTREEASTFFHIGLSLCKNLKYYNGHDHALSIGFNPGDVALPGHHSVGRLHGHLRAYNDPYDLNRIQARRWKDSHWFDRLTFTEPFTQVFYDHIQNYLDAVQDDVFDRDNLRISNGVIDMPMRPGAEGGFPSALIALYSSMKKEYQAMVNIFTQKVIDPETDRYTPNGASEILAGLDAHFSSTLHYSEKSRGLLYYLGRRIKRATKRPQLREQYILDSSHVYLPKSFSGAFTIRHNPEQNNFGVEFLPRVITTSAVAKTIFGNNMPIIMGRHIPATDEQYEKLAQFKEDVKTEVNKISLLK